MTYPTLRGLAEGGVNSSSMDDETRAGDTAMAGRRAIDETFIVPNAAPSGMAELAWSDGYCEEYPDTATSAAITHRPSRGILQWGAVMATLVIAATAVAWFGLDYYRDRLPVPNAPLPAPATVTRTVLAPPPVAAPVPPPVTSTVVAPPVSPGMAYIHGLDLLGIQHFGPDEQVIQSGRNICNALSVGTDASAIRAGLVTNNPVMGQNGGPTVANNIATEIISVAVNTLCPG